MIWIFRCVAIISISLLISLIGVSAFAQGCSDAGFCTIGTLKPQKEDSIKIGQKISFLFPLGIGDENVFVFTPAIQYDNQFSERWSMQAKVTANYAEGNLGNAFGPGDIFLSSTYRMKPKEKWRTSFTVGLKVAMNSGNLKAEGRSLPMQYQSSLGTIDLISGISISDNSWTLSTGWQQPMSGINRNNFLPAVWHDTPEAGKYPPSNDFNRKGDALLRAAYSITLKKFRFTPGLLAIYHLGEDTYVDTSVGNNPIPIAGSQGLTLNITLAGSWILSDRLAIGFSAGTPLIFRDVRPDGLTRKIVFAPEIHWNF
jgi:hypothetical protein